MVSFDSYVKVYCSHFTLVSQFDRPYTFFYKKTIYKQPRFISNLVLDSLKFKKLLELQRKNQEALDKYHIEIVTWFNVKLHQNNVNMTLLKNLTRTDALCLL